MNHEIEALRAYPGLSGRTAELVALLRELWPHHNGPAHIVLADFNLETDHVEWCMGQCRDPGVDYGFRPSHPLMRTTEFVLAMLLEVSEEERLDWKPRRGPQA